MAALSPPQRVVVTGPTGWIGRALLSRAAAGLSGQRVGDHVLAFGSREGVVDLPGGDRLTVRPLGGITPADVDDACVVHLAYLTKEKAQTLGEGAFMATNIAIDDALLAALEGSRCRSLFVASSGAAKLAATGQDLHPYGVAKLRQEARFLDWGAETGIPVIAGRIFNLAGPHINKIESYAISSFISHALRHGRIRIDAVQPVFRSFLHVDDLARLILAAGVHRTRRTAPVDLCGAEVVEMADLAQSVGEAIGPHLSIDRAPVDHGRFHSYLGNHPDTKVLAMELGISLRSLRNQIEDTIAWLSNDTVNGCADVPEIDHKEGILDRFVVGLSAREP